MRDGGKSKTFCVENFSLVNSSNNFPVKQIRKPKDFQLATSVKCISFVDVCLFKIRHIQLLFLTNCIGKTQWGLDAKNRDTDNEIHSL